MRTSTATRKPRAHGRGAALRLMLAGALLFLTAAPSHAQASSQQSATIADAAKPPVADSRILSAIRTDSPRAVRSWLLAGGNPNAIDPKEGPLIVAAAHDESWQVVTALLDSPEIDLDAVNARGENAMMMAALKGRIDIVKLLIEKGAEVNKTGWTPLHYAATAGEVAIIRLLLENAAFIDAQSPNRTTPLMMAARQEKKSVAEVLIAEGADPTQRNEAGFSAADYFKRAGDEPNAAWMAKLAREFEAKYGTIEAPKPVSASPTQAPASPSR